MLDKVTLDTSTQGVLTFWSVQDCSRESLTERMTGFGLEKHLPRPRRNLSMLKDAVEEFARDTKLCTDKLLVRMSKAGVTIVNEKLGMTENEYTTVVSATVDSFGVVTCEQPAYTSSIYDRFSRYRDVITGPQITHTLVSVIDSWHGLTIRENGGLYWLPAKRFGEWQAVMNMVRDCTLPGLESKGRYVEHPVTAHVLEAMHDAIEREVRTETAKIMDELDSDDLGLKAVETRQERAGHLRAKLRSLSSLFGNALDNLKVLVDQADDAAARLALHLSAVGSGETAAVA
jgi:hypothetical protein